ncbi:hypothetical protein ACOME3_001548 [Neoechinorhynchus agilis]
MFSQRGDSNATNAVVVSPSKASSVTIKDFRGLQEACDGWAEDLSQLTEDFDSMAQMVRDREDIILKNEEKINELEMEIKKLRDLNGGLKSFVSYVSMERKELDGLMDDAETRFEQVYGSASLCSTEQRQECYVRLLDLNKWSLEFGESLERLEKKQEGLPDGTDSLNRTIEGQLCAMKAIEDKVEDLKRRMDDG